MKKIYLILIMGFMMISAVYAVDSSNWSNETINEHIFKIPPQYEGGTINKNSYTIDNWNNFAILCIDTFLASNYGFEANSYGPGEDLTINEHPARYFVGYNTYEKTNISRIYFPVGDSIYCISWQGSNLTEDIKEIVSNSDEPHISGDEFYYMLENASNQYLTEEEDTSATYYPTYSSNNHHSHNRYFLLYYRR